MNSRLAWKRFNMIKKLLFVAFIIVLVFFLASVYARFLHPKWLFDKPAFSKVDTAFLSNGLDIQFKSNGYNLYGKVVTKAPAGSKVPLIVFSVGSARSSFKTNYSKFLDSIFLQNLPLDSIAVMYFDKRGIGKSEGTWYDADFDERAEDVKAAADFGKTLPFVDSSNIIVVGHSQGGWIAQLCLAKYPETFSGGISMAGPTYDVRTQLITDYTSRIRCEEHLELQKAKEKAKRKVARDIVLASWFPFKQEWHQLKVIKNYNHQNVLKQIKKPLLLMFAENDALVYPDWCRDALGIAFTKLPTNIDTVTIKGATHGFQMADLCYDGPSTALSYSTESKKVLRLWINSLNLSK